jgi:hypothetical protein
MEDYEAFARGFVSKKPHVKYFRTTVMRRVKWEMTVRVKSDLQAIRGLIFPPDQDALHQPSGPQLLRR